MRVIFRSALTPPTMMYKPTTAYDVATSNPGHSDGPGHSAHRVQIDKLPWRKLANAAAARPISHRVTWHSSFGVVSYNVVQYRVFGALGEIRNSCPDRKDTKRRSSILICRPHSLAE